MIISLSVKIQCVGTDTLATKTRYNLPLGFNFDHGVLSRTVLCHHLVESKAFQDKFYSKKNSKISLVI